MLRSLAVFSIVGALHFFLSVLGLLFVLPAAFETQGGSGFWAAPGKSLLAGMATVLLAPLGFIPAGPGFGFLEIAAVSAMFGLGAVGLYQLWGMVRRRSAP
jgi:hypothetical protein